MTKMGGLFPAILLLSGSLSANAWADSNIGVQGSLSFPVSGAAPPMSDPFNYALSGRPPFYSPSPVPDPWDFASLGGSTNSVTYNYASFNNPLNKVLALTYSGTGWYLLTRVDLPAVYGTSAIYQLDFQDDGTRDLGELFKAEDAQGHFAGVGVNNRVVNGYYYFRNDRDPEMPIYARRDGMHANGDWHTFKLMVTPWGSYGTVDDVYAANSWYTGLNQATDVTLQGDWRKPAHTVLVDNFVVTPQGGLAPGTILTGAGSGGVPGRGGPGRLYNPFGDAELLTMDQNDLNALLESDLGSWQTANPIRAGIVRTALREANYRECDGDALSRYDASGEWCSEFARWVFDNSPGATNSFIHDWLSGLDSTEDVVTTFKDYNCGQLTGPGYTPRQYMTPSTPKPGDYLAQVSGSTGKRNGHSSIVVGVSSDARYIWTVEGNINTGPNTPHCVHFGYRDFFVNGVLNPDLDGVGSSAVLVNTPNCPKY